MISDLRKWCFDVLANYATHQVAGVKIFDQNDAPSMIKVFETEYDYVQHEMKSIGLYAYIGNSVSTDGTDSYLTQEYDTTVYFEACIISDKQTCERLALIVYEDLVTVIRSADDTDIVGLKIASLISPVCDYTKGEASCGIVVTISHILEVQ